MASPRARVRVFASILAVTPAPPAPMLRPMGYEYRISFARDERSTTSREAAAKWQTFRPRLLERLAALAECTTRGDLLELRTPANQAKMPDLLLGLRDAEIYVCRNGNSALTQRVLGTILFGLADEGIVGRFSAIE